MQTTVLKQKESKIKGFKGPVVVPGDAAYEESRKIYNGMIDKRPAIIARCHDAGDVVLAVNYARAEKMEVSVRSGGHNGAGLSLCDGGLVIDLSLLKDIKIDAVAKTAMVQAGCVLGEIDKAAHQHGLALPSGIISTTGIGGITLGGGIGYLSRKFGLTIDHLLEAEMVLADGRQVKTSKDSHPDLFWAIRGGGGNFGVVTSFLFQLQPLHTVYAGPMFWPMEKAEEAMKIYRKLMTDAPDDLYGFFAFLIVPPADPFPRHLHNQTVCGVVWNYTGPLEKAEEVFKPIRAFGPPILDFTGPIAYPALQSMFDGLYPPGLQWYWKADFFKELSDEAIPLFIKHGAKTPTIHSTIHLYPINGKAGSVAPGDTAWAHRDAKWAEVIVGVDPDPANNNKVISWCKAYWEALHPYSSGGAYVNFMMDETGERVRDSYGDNYEKLAKIKSKYDPKNFFHINQNIKPERK